MAARAGLERAPNVWGDATDMSFEVVIAKQRHVCTCICSYHHTVNDGDSLRCALFIEPGQPMAENGDTDQNRRRCLPCAELAGIIATGAALAATGD